jgi:transcription termination/antitermination protein NusA
MFMTSENENKSMLNMVDALSNAKGVSNEVIFDAVEQALAMVTSRRYDGDINVRVEIDRETGNYQTYRRWMIIPDDLEEDDESYNSDQNLKLSVAREQYSDESLSQGEWVEELIESIDFGRIGAQQAKQVIIQKIREAEREKIKLIYEKRLGEMVLGVVKKVTREYLVVDLGESAEAYLSRSNLIPRETFRMNDRIRIVLDSIREEPRGPQINASRVCPEFIIELFKLEVPEISEEVVDIVSAARDPGMRAKVAVKTNDGRVDPVGACVGMRGARVQAVSNELNGERVDIVLWDDNPAQLVINAMKPAEIASLVVDEDSKQMDIAVTEDQLSLAIGRGGQNIRLASELTGWKLNVMSEADAVLKHETEADRVRSVFTEQLDVDDEIASILVGEGFTSVESLAFAEEAELVKINGLDEDLVVELQSRANDVLLIAEISGDDEQGPDQDLLELEGLSAETASLLASKGVCSRDDLAELSIAELQDIIDINDDLAGELIMKARAHWFTDK